MNFGQPSGLVALVILLPLAGWCLLRSERRHRMDVESFGDPEVLARSSRLSGRRHRRTRHALRLTVLAAALLALARPQLGTRPAALARTGRDVLVLLDLSRSMRARDLKPNRLEAAKRVAAQLIAASPGDRVGLIVFGGSAFLQLPLTTDHAAFELFLRAASPDDLNDPSTDLSAALAAAARTLEHEGEPHYAAVLLISDGENSGDDIEPGLSALKARRVPVFSVGLGTEAGAPVPADSSEAPERYHRDHIGRIVLSALRPDQLRKAAEATGGGYSTWNDPAGMRRVAAGLAGLRARILATQESTQRADRFQWPLGLAIAALLSEPLIGGRRKRGRPQ